MGRFDFNLREYSSSAGDGITLLISVEQIQSNANSASEALLLHFLSVFLMVWIVRSMNPLLCGK